MSEFIQHILAAADGHPIVARLYEPPGRPKAAVLIVPAMGVAQAYYAPFAAWLARRGFLAATFDYRGMGLSRTGSLRGFRADIFDWARLDCAAVIDTLTARVPGEPLYWIGHSLGGQIVPFVPNRDRAARIVTIAAGSGYWRENAARARRFVPLLWYVIVPLTVRLFGYFPGRRLRMVGDLPRGVVNQWRRWCLHPEYAAGAEDAHALYAAVRTPILSLSFADDEFMSGRGIASLHASYVNAPRIMKRLAPEDVGVQRIGHFGFFRPAFEHSLWEPHLLPELAYG